MVDEFSKNKNKNRCMSFVLIKKKFWEFWGWDFNKKNMRIFMSHLKLFTLWSTPHNIYHVIKTKANIGEWESEKKKKYLLNGEVCTYTPHWACHVHETFLICITRSLSEHFFFFVSFACGAFFCHCFIYL